VTEHSIDFPRAIAQGPENSDDALGPVYLGNRLGTGCVPKPATRVVGLKSMAYFDAPATPKGNPQLVTNAPCVVFEQVDRDGGRHAHRIYTTPNGTGKAQLGTRRCGRI
jgi:hypothetical protein